MTLIPTRISPSAEARHLFNTMICCSVNGRLDFTNTIHLAVARQSAGFKDHEAVEELCREGWIAAGDDGGWLVLQ